MIRCAQRRTDFTMTFSSSVRLAVPFALISALAVPCAGQDQTPATGQAASASTTQAAPQGPVQAEKTPAEMKYGLPKTPSPGAATDRDLSTPLTLDRAISIALANQNSIAIASAQTDVTRAQLVQARSSYFPQIVPSFQYQNSLTPTAPFSNGVGAGVIRGPLISESTTDALVAKQLIFDTGLREANVGLNRRNQFASEYALGDVRQTVIFNVTSDYYNLLEDKELVRVETESVKRSQVALDVINAQYQAKLAAQVDTLQAQADLANARVALIQAQTSYDLAQAALKNAMGIVSAQPLVLAAESATQPSLSQDANGLQKYVSLAYGNRLDVKQQQEIVNAEGYNLRIARINNGITVNANVLEGYQLDPDSGEERTFVVDVSYPLFDGGNTRAAVRASEAQLTESRRTLDQLEQSVHLQVEQAYDAREEERRNIAETNTAVAAGQANYQAALGKQQQGQINVLDVVTAEQQLVTAEVNQVQALYNYYIADAQLQRSIGVNDPAYLPRVPHAHPPQLALGAGGSKSGSALAAVVAARSTASARGAVERKP